MKNVALSKWKDGAASPGAWINLPELHTAELLARMGFDWLCFDLQHGLMSYSHLLNLIPAISGTSTSPLVRVTSNDAGQIGRALDAGAHGVIVPMINTAEQAERAVAACRYPSAGIRSCGPMRGAMLEGLEYLSSANAEIACVVMIETAEGLANVEAIAAIDGVDGIFIGPMDLCYGLGLAPGDFAAPEFGAAIERIQAACKQAGIAVGLFGYTPELAGKALQDGFQFVSVGTDIGFLLSAESGLRRRDLAFSSGKLQNRPFGTSRHHPKSSSLR
jgi:4-hydroxy-2-oxoheptanedioate aldolase